MLQDYDNYLSGCLFFAASELVRKMAKIADEEFMITKLSPSYAVLLMLISENEGLCQADAAKIMALAPSTVTRFVDKLVDRGLIYRKVEGKASCLFATDEGKKLNGLVHKAWANVYQRFCDLIGEERVKRLTEEISFVNKGLKG